MSIQSKIKELRVSHGVWTAIEGKAGKDHPQPLPWGPALGTASGTSAELQPRASPSAAQEQQQTAAVTAQKPELQLLYTAQLTAPHASLCQATPSQCEGASQGRTVGRQWIFQIDFTKNCITQNWVCLLLILVQGNWHHVSVLPSKHRKLWSIKLLSKISIIYLFLMYLIKIPAKSP